MIEVKDILHLLGNELKDGTEQVERFREFIEKEKWPTEQIKRWLDECISGSKGAHDPYNRAFQDLIVSLGKRLGFEIQYGSCNSKRRIRASDRRETGNRESSKSSSTH